MATPRPAGHILLPLVVGLAALAVTGWLWWHEHHSADATARADFDFSVRLVSHRIEQRMASYEQMLRAMRGFIEGSKEVSREEFNTFVDALSTGPEFAGLQVMLHIRPSTTDDKAIIVAAAPDSPENRQVLGNNPFQHPDRRAALLQARDSGEMAVTPRLSLAADRYTGPAAAVAYMAVYGANRNGDTQEARRAALRGWVGLAFRLRDLMASLYGDGIPGVALAIHDGVTTRPDSLMYEARPTIADANDAPPRFTATEYISFPRHTWTLKIETTPDFEARHSRRPEHLILVVGTCGSVLLALFTWLLVTGQARAQATAHSMTRELRESEARLRHLAEHDPLTELPNRALLATRLRDAIAVAARENGKAGLMFVDLDRFKNINDAYGHGIGDQLLVAAASRMRECLRESDTLARLGGDEFVVLLPHIADHRDAELVGSRIRAAIAEPFAIAGHTLRISASIGIGVFPHNGSDEVSLMKSADDAMYRAKDIGRDRLVFA